MNDLITQALSKEGLSYSQKDAVKEIGTLMAQETALLKELKGATPAVQKAWLAAKEPGRKLRQQAQWATLWLFYIGAWAFLMMVFRSNVYPR